MPSLARQRIDREIGARRLNLCIGTGGNVEALGDLRRGLLRKRSNTTITLYEIETLIETIGTMTMQERIEQLGSTS